MSDGPIDVIFRCDMRPDKGDLVFTLKKTSHFRTTLEAVAEKFGVASMNRLNFILLNGFEVRSIDTPRGLKLNNNDVILVNLQTFVMAHDSRIKLKIHDPDGEYSMIDVQGGVKMERVIFAYAFKNRWHPPSVKFLMNDREILGEDTPESLNMDELQLVEVRIVEKK